MILFNYPNNETSWLADFNRRVNLMRFNKGGYGLAFDVWRDKTWLFGSYNYEQAESMSTFCERNYPDIEHPEYGATAMGAGPNVGAIERFQVPTWAAIDHAYSLTSIRQILAAALATAVYPYKFPTFPENVPNPNALRQRMHNSGRDWMRLIIQYPQDDVVIRAIVARSQWTSERPLATYDVSLYQRADSLLQRTLEPSWCEIQAPVGDMRNVEERTEVLRLAKKHIGVTGFPSRVIEQSEGGFVLHLDSEPFNLGVTLKDKPEDYQPKTEGFSL